MHKDWVLVVGERNLLIESFFLANGMPFIYILKQEHGCESVKYRKFAFGVWDSRMAAHDDKKLNEFLIEFGKANPEAKRIVIAQGDSPLKFRSDFTTVQPPELHITEFEDALGLFHAPQAA